MGEDGEQYKLREMT